MNEIQQTLGNGWIELLTQLWRATILCSGPLLCAIAVRRAPARVTHALWTLAVLPIALVPLTFAGRLDTLFRSLIGGRGPIPAADWPILQTVWNPAQGLEPTSASMSHGWAIAVSLIWAIGAITLLARVAWEVLRSHTQTRVEPPSDLDLELALEGLEIPRDRVAVSPEIVLPHVAGFWSPHILIPATLVNELSTSELRAVLLHEDAHRRRRDPLRNLGLRIVGALLFFHPLIGMLGRRLRESAELVCDEQVIGSGVDPGVYAQALARTVRAAVSPMTIASGAVSSRASLKERLDRLSNRRRYQMKPRYWALVTVAVAFVVAGFVLAPTLSAGDTAPKVEKEAPSSVEEGANAASSEKDQASKKKNKQKVASKTKTKSKSDTGASTEAPKSKSDSGGSGDTSKSTSDTGSKENAGADTGSNDDAESDLGFDTPPTPTHMVPAKYPEKARQKAIEGIVYVLATISDKGVVTHAEVEPEKTDAIPPLQQSAIDACLQWEFKPAEREGKPVTCRIVIPFKFKLS